MQVNIVPEDYARQIKRWLSEDPMRMQALLLASGLGLPDWCLAAGFVRNLVWDKLHQLPFSTELDDIDLIYFDPINTDPCIDSDLTQRLQQQSSLPWSVKNQARMHSRNFDAPYRSTADAMSYWVELETAIGARLNALGEIELVSPFGVGSLFSFTVTLNGKRPKPEAFYSRLSTKHWLQNWPLLRVSEEA